MEIRTYKTAEAFRAALETRLVARASSGGLTLARLRQQVAFDRFLARLFQDGNPDFMLKGGYAMELRLRHKARFSRDLDLTAKHEKHMDASAWREKLQMLATKDLGDWFSFRIAVSSMDLEGAPYTGYRFPVDARLSSRSFVKFHVDVASGDAVLDDPVWVKGSPLLDFAGIPSPTIALLPSETHFAEKIHAYTRPREGRLNSRVRDLIDIVLLLDEGLEDLDNVRGALESTFRRRKTHPLPDTLQPPHSTWTKPYADIAAEIGLRTETAVDAFQKLSAYWTRLYPKGVS
ncbi:MAG: nucleotidyl transferase AbiEii/AbiGii toxin family protein [Elusimicrobiota bacterium]|jgi:predicted nucleotidyltransferase component of viral defense system